MENKQIQRKKEQDKRRQAALFRSNKEKTKKIKDIYAEAAKKTNFSPRAYGEAKIRPSQRVIKPRKKNEQIEDEDVEIEEGYYVNAVLDSADNYNFGY